MVSKKVIAQAYLRGTKPTSWATLIGVAWADIVKRRHRVHRQPY